MKAATLGAAAILAALPSLAYAQQVPAIEAGGNVKMAAAALPPGLPPHVSLPSPPATLDAKERRAVALAHRWKSRAEMPQPGPDGVVRFLFGATLPTVVCAPLQTCDLALQPGEIVNNVNLGDKVRWTVTPAMSGAGASMTTHLNIKPHDAGLSTSLTIYTTRRTYAVRLVSTAAQWMPLVGFDYPDDAAGAWANYRQSVVFGTTAAPAGGSDAAALSFYRIEGDRPGWRPVRAWTDGAKTVIEFPHSIGHMTAPALVALGTDGGWFSGPTQQVVNYRVEGDRYVVDRVLSRAELVSGVGDGQEHVTITKEGAR